MASAPCSITLRELPLNWTLWMLMERQPSESGGLLRLGPFPP